MKPRPTLGDAHRAWPAAVLVAGLALSLGCAQRTDAQVRKAWGGSSTVPEAGNGPARANDATDNDDDEGSAPIRVGWERLDELVDAAIVETSHGADEAVLARLARQWCRVEPVPEGSGDDRRRVCVPDPPMQIEGHAFDLEMGGEGVIGLVAHDLSEGESAGLAAAALLRTARWCNRDWDSVTPPSQPKDATAPKLHTCAVGGSALLSVGRFLSEDGVNWTLSVAVIDAS